jgi:hypothetical protein
VSLAGGRDVSQKLPRRRTPTLRRQNVSLDRPEASHALVQLEAQWLQAHSAWPLNSASPRASSRPYFNPDGPTPGALQGDDYPIEMDADGYPIMPACLRRSPE